MRVARHTVVLAVVCAIAAAAAPALAGFDLEAEHPVMGEAVTVTLVDAEAQPLAGAPVSVTYFPGSAVEKTVAVGVTDASGQLAWVPEHAGLAVLASGDTSRTLGVRFDGLPFRGLIVFIVAGTLLFGAIFFGSRMILRGDYVDPTT